MYTLTRKLSVVCLTVVLSFLVYGCGGSSKQALITEVTDMVTEGLMPEPGTYTIEPGGTAYAGGDVSLDCPPGGPPCEVTVADDGTFVMSTSAEGMVIAMNSASAAARLLAEEERDTANMNLETAQGALATANMNLETAQGALATANMNLETAQGALATANMNLETTQGERDDANLRVTNCEDALATANMNLATAQGALDDRQSSVGSRKIKVCSGSLKW